ncbi:RNA-binding S4 domain-containing protein [Conexibacter woesei]|uniref:RNA-binding S4 domain protein n=1 Tax=Conexibacter woesei (strain DSM 14684 / CCUG 47730 / CIP 108061 / JCM 11494 / NBRC 100937 / ID131577) TaxID=469383 RepID=D3F693_CONWI|nr:RNA-binding S4 domain-containing protein [Conexibacter woesei]ADB48766.1 RNA-binding S4 domain protein [Conexibacter woesei DSM 14684]
MSETEAVRVDKWLWAARFYKTRGLASEAVKGGHVEINGVTVKPSKDVRVGDRLEVGVGQTRFVVDVRALSGRRGPASAAALLYEETPESRAARERAAELRRMEPLPDPAYRGGGRPTKRDRRRFDQTGGGRGGRR